MTAPRRPPGRSARPDLRSLPLDRLERLVASLGERPFRARQLYRWLHQKGAASLDEMTDVPRALRAALAERTTLTTLERATEQRSVRRHHQVDLAHARREARRVGLHARDRPADALRLDAGRLRGRLHVLPHRHAWGSRGTSAPGEIVDQVHRANRRIVELGHAEGPRPLTNLVFMGMGEPLANYRSLKVALDLLLSEDGPNFSHRHVTVSTSGLVPMIRRLGEETPVKLAISLNATTDAQRDALMPINRRYPLARAPRGLPRASRCGTAAGSPSSTCSSAGVNDSLDGRRAARAARCAASRRR